MGTFAITPDSISVSSGTFRDNTSGGVYAAVTLATVLSNNIVSGGPPPYPQSINSFTGGSVLTEDAVLRMGFSLVGNIISLDGSPVISFAGLPAGFTVSTALISIYTTNNGSDGTNHFRVTFDPSVESGDLNFTNPRTFSHPSPPSTLLFFTQGCGIHVNNLTVGQQTSRWFGNYKITGTYTIVNPTYTISPNTGLKAGDKVTITGPNINNIAGVQVSGSGSGIQHTIPAQDFISQSTTQLVFYFPQFGNGSSASVFVVGDGTQFSGSVLAGSVTTLFVDGSGLYQLIQNKGTDTVYNAARDGTTTDINIQDPTGETAFIP